MNDEEEYAYVDDSGATDEASFKAHYPSSWDAKRVLVTAKPARVIHLEGTKRPRPCKWLSESYQGLAYCRFFCIHVSVPRGCETCSKYTMEGNKQ